MISKASFATNFKVKQKKKGGTAGKIFFYTHAFRLYSMHLTPLERNHMQHSENVLIQENNEQPTVINLVKLPHKSGIG